MARQDLRKQITIYPPNGGPGEKHTLLNARDLITHSGWSTTPQHKDQFSEVDDIMANAVIEPTEEELIRQALLAKPVDLMTLTEIHEFVEAEFGAKIDKRLNRDRAIDRLKEMADASNYKLKFSDNQVDPDEEDADEDQEPENEDTDQE